MGTAEIDGYCGERGGGPRWGELSQTVSWLKLGG